MSYFKDWLNRIFKRRPTYQGPLLRPSYNVYDGESLLATLTHPVVPDQFWIEFVLSPTTDDPERVEKLYSSDFWLSDRIVIAETDSGRRVNFLLSPYAIDADDEEITEVDYMQERPKRVVLRGPYEYRGSLANVLEKYGSYFHDGSIIFIDHGSEIRIAMESSEIWAEDLVENVVLSQSGTIKGILTISGMRSLELDGQLSKERLEMKADSATILDFDLSGSKVHFFIEWMNFRKSGPVEKHSDIIIEADKFTWQDDPGLFDPYAH